MAHGHSAVTLVTDAPPEGELREALDAAHVTLKVV